MTAARRIALALMNHAAWVLPAQSESWGRAMQYELPQIESDPEALAWAGGCLFASYATRVALCKKLALSGLLAVIFIAAASWWAGQRPYLTPGNHRIFREDSTPLALIGFFILIAASISVIAAVFAIVGGEYRKAARAGRICATILGPYLAALTLVSLLTPRTIVNIGDSYCYDLWCLGVDQVNAIPSGRGFVYTANVSISLDSSHPHRIPWDRAKKFFYVLDEQGHRYPLLAETSFRNAGVVLQPGESLQSSLEFRVPQDAKKLYLTGDDTGPPWVLMYFGSDISLFHRRTLLRIL